VFAGNGVLFFLHSRISLNVLTLTKFLKQKWEFWSGKKSPFVELFMCITLKRHSETKERKKEEEKKRSTWDGGPCVAPSCWQYVIITRFI
jgi:hypothetical protein